MHQHPIGEVLPRWHPAVVVAAVWALAAIALARRGYARPGGAVEVPRLPPLPRLPEGAVRGVDAALARRRQRCLVRATVRQAWERSQDRGRDLVIGVTAPSGGFRAHAWLDGDPPCCTAEFTELTRRPSPS